MFIVASCLVLIQPLAGRAHEGVEHDIERVSEAIARDSSDASALIERARFYRIQGQLDLSLADLDQARLLDASAPGIDLQRGLTLAALGRDDEAEEELDQVLRRAPDSVGALVERAKIRARTNRIPGAISDLDVAIRHEPGLDLYLERGHLQESGGELEAAAAGYRQGLEALGEALLLRKALVRMEVARGRYDEALRMIDDRLASGALMPEWYLEQAQVLDVLERSAAAERARRAALAHANQALRNRATSANLVQRARVHWARGDEASARRDLEQALRYSPQMESAMTLLSQIEKASASE